jgi:hypothetical protein
MKSEILLICLLAIPISLFSQSTRVQYLSGTDKDHTVPWDFYCTGGRGSGKWTKIAVPSNWELQGFGSYNYGHDKVKANERGLYKYSFYIHGLQGKKVFIAFEGVMTDALVKVNGKVAGPAHQGGFYRFKYDITRLLIPGARNVLEVTVDKMSADASVNRAERNGDFWLYGGIYRPVYLEIVPSTFIDRMAIDAKADGAFQMDVYPENLKGGETISAQVQKLTGENVGAPMFISAATPGKAAAFPEKFTLTGHFDKPLLWSSEFPNLYQVVAAVKNKNGIIHRVKQRFGFRTVELRAHDGLYVNGARIMLKGTDRHSFWPETGRTLSHPIQLMDVRLMREMNMNAVRMSHYPPDQDFLDVCDSLGLYVLDELTGWQASYDTLVGHKLVKEMVVRDVNHPSIIFWDNGNEGGWNTGLDGDYNLYDPQRRTVIHPFERFNGTNTKHYPDYNYVVQSVADDKDVFFPTEFMHGLYDGGAGAALDDFWNLMMKHPHGAGGFIWAFLDEAVLRTDKNGIYDADGNHAPDGIVGPHREKEASFFTIKEIWSPVYIDPQPIDKSFDGRVPVGNRYSFTNLDRCTFEWKLITFPPAGDKSTQANVTATGVPLPLSLAPGEKGTLDLHLPSSWSNNDALYLTAYGPDRQELFTWSWGIRVPSSMGGVPSFMDKAPPRLPGGSPAAAEESGHTLIVHCDGIKYFFDRTTGYIEKVVKHDRVISLSGGPVLAGVPTELKEFNDKAVDGQYIVEAAYRGRDPMRAAAGSAGLNADSMHIRWTFAPGRPAKMEYTYIQHGDADFMGITFDYPEGKITGMKWLGRGPYRVWKNRLKGQQLGVWYKAYNNTVTGESWNYPEFKGYHAGVEWAVIENSESPFTVYTDDKDMYLQMLHPQREKAAPANNNVDPPFPPGSIGFLQAISPIGTKFQPAKVMGPQSQKNHARGEPVSGTLWFGF